MDDESSSRPYTPEEIQDFVCSIINHDMEDSAQLLCGLTISPRYQPLLVPEKTLARPKIRYFFALDLHQSVHIIIPLIGSVIEAIRYLGPRNCALSIVEGRSTDGTAEILADLKTELDHLGIIYFFSRSDINPLAEGENRIYRLAQLRNMAIAPLLDERSRRLNLADPAPTIVFINDVVLCAEDILELIYQKQVQGASVACAFDWTSVGTIYDIWVSRDMAGDLFFHIPPNGVGWDNWNPFSHHPPSQDRFSNNLPIQVYACWGGMITVDSTPFLQKKIHFRASNEGECFMPEPMTLAKDLWTIGMGRLLAAPTVNVAYSYKDAQMIKRQRGYVHRIVEDPSQYSLINETIRWEGPPEKLKCMNAWDNQTWIDPVYT
ncbi:hypothetical protein N7492_006953 [Penicillium capsulatum]|uniref:Alpha-1,3-mannosyltransferase CMT1 n=1 Tax=Penicillium capsulatum TaxID=69766 RepID=A0A9W9I131_9EURO|nr:hypothetical protein N7492_006953 [Penicillium capsulatum]